MSVAVFHNVASLFRPHVAGNLAVFALKVLSLHVLVFSARIARKRLERGAVVVGIDVGEPNLVAPETKGLKLKLTAGFGRQFFYILPKSQ